MYIVKEEPTMWKSENLIIPINLTPQLILEEKKMLNIKIEIKLAKI